MVLGDVTKENVIALEKSVENTQRTYIKLALGIPLAVILVILMIWGGWRAYASWEEGHQLRRAAAFLAGGGVKPATLCARRALQLNPKSTRAMRVMADVGERVRDPAAVDWRRKIVELEPGSSENILALAECAVQFGNTSAAERALDSIEPGQRETAPFHAAAARLATARKDLTRAGKEWSEALRLEPDNESYQMQFALSLLEQTDEKLRQEGCRILKGLRDSPEFRSAATRSLIFDGILHRRDPKELRELANDLQSYPDASFGDRLMYMDILRFLNDADYAGYLTNIEKDASEKPADLAALLSWMTGKDMSIVAIDFARSLPEKLLEAWPVPRAMAEVYAKVSDWRALENLTAKANWEQSDFLRRAYLTRALRALDNSVAAEREWAGAVKDASAQPAALLSLIRTISGWKWENEAVDLLWQLAKHPETQVEALQTLYSLNAKNNDTQGLYRVLVRLADVDPGDLKVQNNLAQISLLLSADRERARKLAADLYEKDPSEPAFASTYAFSLYSKGETGPALQVMNKLSEDQLKEPALAAYYGVFLTAAGKTSEARQYLDIGKQAHLLPEERTLVERAEAASR